MSGSGNRDRGGGGGGGGGGNSSSGNSFNDYGSKVNPSFSDREIALNKNDFSRAVVVHQRVDPVTKQPIMYPMKKRELLLAKVCGEDGDFFRDF